MTNTMMKYLMLEDEMFRLEKAGESADAVRDRMDPLWYEFSDEEREEMNRRVVGQVITEPIVIPASEVFVHLSGERDKA